MEDEVEIAFSGLQAMADRRRTNMMRVQFVTDFHIRSCKLRDEVTPDGWQGHEPFNDFPVGGAWNFIQHYREPEIAFVAHLLLEECVRIAKGVLGRHPSVYVKVGNERYYLVEDPKDPQSGDGVGKWIVRDKSQGNLKWLGGLLGERLKPLNDRQRGWFQAFRKEIKGPRGETEFETPYDCAVAVYERIKELLARGSRAGDDETVAQVANIMLRSAPVVEYGTLLRTPRFLEKIVFGERYYEALKRSGDD